MTDCPNCESLRTQLTAANAALEEAREDIENLTKAAKYLQVWHCPKCNGAGKRRFYGSLHVCQYCNGDKLHPTARIALANLEAAFRESDVGRNRKPRTQGDTP